MAKFFKPIKSILLSLLGSLWLKFLLLITAVLIYNHLCYTQQWMTSGHFGDTVAPLYANVKPWIEDSISQAHPDEDLSVQQGITDFIRQLDKPSRTEIEKGLADRTPWLLTPLVIFVLIGGGIVVQLSLKRQIAPWVIVAMLPLLTLCVNVSVGEVAGGPPLLIAPFQRTDLEYFGDVHRVNDSPIEFIHDYATTVEISNPMFKLTHHARTHPPGAILFLWWIGQHINPDVQTASWAAILATSLASIPAYLMARHRFGNTAGLLAAGIYLLTPSLVLFGATSMDGVFALPMITTLWLLVMALMRRFDDSAAYTIRPGWSSIFYAILAGITLTIAAFMSYATVCIGIVIAIFLNSQLLVSWRWFLRSVIVMAIVTAVFLGCTWWLHAATGYDPIACVQASMKADESVVGSVRKHWIDVSFANGIAFLIGAGLITTTLWLSAVGTSIQQLIRRNAANHVFELAMFVAIVVICFSRLFTLETERIWIFLMPLLIAPAANQLLRISRSRPTLVMQSVVVLIVLMAQTWICQLFLNTWW